MLRWSCNYDPKEDHYEILARWLFAGEDLYVSYRYQPRTSEFTLSEIVKELHVQVASFDPTPRLLQ